jgi:MFS family permease
MRVVKILCSCALMTGMPPFKIDCCGKHPPADNSSLISTVHFLSRQWSRSNSAGFRVAESPRPIDQHTDDIEAAEFEPTFDEVPHLPWDSIMREWVSRRNPNAARSPFGILFAVLLGNFSAGIVFTLLSVARKAISEDLHTTQSLVLWAFTGPTLVAAILAPALGRLGDLRGHRPLYLLALFGGALGSLLVGFSPNVYALIGFRTIAAAATVGLGPSSLAIIFRAFDKEQRVKAMGFWSLVGAGAPVLGVLAGGPMVDRFGWRSMFFAQVPFFVIALIVAIRVIPSVPTRPGSRFDAKGAVLLGLTTLLVLLGANRGPEWGWTDPRVLTFFALAPCSMAAFVSWQQRAEHPLLALQLLKIRNVVGGIGAQMLAQFSYIGAGLFLVNDLLVGKGFFGYTLSDASRSTIARPIAFAVIAPVSGLLAVRFGERVVATMGMACIAFSMLLLVLSRPGSSLAALIIAIAFSGLGMGMASPSLSATVANAVPEHVLGTIGALQQLMVQMGTVIGTQVMVAIVTTHGARTASSYRSAFLVALIVAALATVCASLCRRLPRVSSTGSPVT